MGIEIKDRSTPVVVFRVGTHGSVGLLRSLGRLGIDVYALHAPAQWRDPSTYSRYCHGRFAWDFESESAQSSVEFLLNVGKSIGRRSILIPSTDEIAVFAAEHFQALQEWFIYPEQSASLVRSLTSKREARLLAQKCGVATPCIFVPRHRQDVVDFAETAVFPVMLKASDGPRFWRRTGRDGKIIVKTPLELLELYARLEDFSDPNLMLQEYIPGSDDSVWMFNGYFDRRSRCLASFTGRKIRQAPVYTGVTSLGICTKNKVVEKTTIDLMQALGYRGILDIGYRFDARDGQYKVLDINPRIGASFRLFVAENGMDVVRALYLDLTNQPIPLVSPREGRKWIVETADLKSCFHYRRDGKLTAKQWITSFKQVEEGAYFALDDIAPFFHQCTSVTFRALKHFLGGSWAFEKLGKRLRFGRFRQAQKCVRDERFPTSTATER